MHRSRIAVSSLCLVTAMTDLASAQEVIGSVQVTVENFVRAESDRYFRIYASAAGRELGKFRFARDVSDITTQKTVRQNRDTLYGVAVFDLDAGPVTITLPDPGERFMSLQIIDQDQYSPAMFYEPGPHTLTREAVGTRYAIAATRVLVDPDDPADIDRAVVLQDAIKAEQPGGPGTLDLPDWDQDGLTRVRDALLVLAETIPDSRGMFGPRGDVDPVRHLIGTASLWGGNRPEDASYLNVTPRANDGTTIHKLRVPKEVPVDGFWSVSLYNAKGFFQQNDLNAYSLNNMTAKKATDGSVDIQFGGCEGGMPNCLPIMDGWNYMVRLYRPRAEVLDGSWTFPAAEPVP